MKPHRAGRNHRSKQTSPQAKPKPDVISLALISEQEGASFASVEFTEQEFEAIAAQAARVGGYQKMLLQIASGTVIAAADACGSRVAAATVTAPEQGAKDKIYYAMGEMEFALLENNALNQLIIESMECQAANGNWTEEFAEKMVAGIAALSQATKDRLDTKFKAIYSAIDPMKGEVPA